MHLSTGTKSSKTLSIKLLPVWDCLSRTGSIEITPLKVPFTVPNVWLAKRSIKRGIYYLISPQVWLPFAQSKLNISNSGNGISTVMFLSLAYYKSPWNERCRWGLARTTCTMARYKLLWKMCNDFPIPFTLQEGTVMPSWRNAQALHPATKTPSTPILTLTLGVYRKTHCPQFHNKIETWVGL